MKKFLLAPFLAALAVFFLGFLYWGLPPHLPYKALGTVADDSATALALGKMFPTSGAYVIPNPMGGDEKMMALAKRGPTVEVHITKEPMTEIMQVKTMVLGFAHEFVICLLLTVLLCGLEKSFERWTCRVKFMAFLGFLVAVCDLGNAIWWHHDLCWTLAQALYDFLFYIVVGLVLAKFVTPKPAA